MNRHVRVDVHADGFQLRLVLGEIVGDDRRGHAPGEACVGAEGLDVDKVSPAADALADQKAADHQVQRRHELHPADLAHQKADQHAADESAIDGHAAAAGVEDLAEILSIVVPLQDHIVGPGSHDAADGAAQNDVEHPVGVHAKLPGAAADVQNRQNKAQRDQDAVPVYRQVPNRKGHSVYLKIQPQSGEGNGVCCLFHEKLLLILFYAITIERQLFPVEKSSRRRCSSCCRVQFATISTRS